MPLHGCARCDVRKKMTAKSPLGRGKGRQALGWVADSKQRPTPSGCATTVVARPPSLRDRWRCATAVAAPATPPQEGIFLGVLRLHPKCSSIFPRRKLTDWRSSSIPFTPSSIETHPSKPAPFKMENIRS